MIAPCIGIGRRLGHNFQPRYDTAPTLSRAKNIDAGELARVLEASAKQTYVCDVCTRCGQKVSR